MTKLPRATKAYPANSSPRIVRIEIHQTTIVVLLCSAQCQELLGENNKREAKRATRGGWPLLIMREMSRVRKINPAK